MTKQARSSSATPWWRGAAIYQIYPRSFADSNGDGIGDLPGITARLDYVAALGVDAIWLSPFFRSPMADFGYDVSDYCDVDPIFGTLADFDALVARAHGLGLKVLIDQVYAHTSDAHSWFAQSRADRSNPFADWYVWADAKPDGSPPNNWQAVFGGAAWTWDARRQQYYCHNFYASQPQLNVHHAPVRAALLDVARFWLDRGVDGFRLDAINFAMHDPQLRDNPPMPEGEGGRTRPFDFQLHIHNQSHPDVPHFLEDIRALADGYGDVFTVAEVGGPLAPQEMRDYTQGNTRLSSAYSFAFLYAEALTPALVKAALAAWPDEPGMGWPSWAFSNHDAPRWISRWAPKGHEAAYARLVMLLFVCLRGNIIIWQGEELGLPQVDIGFEDLQDREAIANWPLTLSRDGSRTPMPWQADALHCGFSPHKPWLPIGPDHPERAVDRQAADQTSMLSFTRALMQWRKDSAVLRTGTIRVIKAAGDLLVIERAAGDERLICAFNLGLEPCDWSAPAGDWQVEQGVGEATPTRLAALSGTVLKAAAA